MFFEKKFNKTQEGLAKFLVEHFRYQTMGSLNVSTSYAQCVKVDRLGLRGSRLEKAYEILDTGEYWSELRWPLDFFKDEWCGAYSIASNGRCNGYLILCEAEIYDPGYKSTCKHCGQLNYQAATEGSTCGVCKGPRVNLKAPLRWSRVKSSPIDHRMSFQDYMDMGYSWLKDRAELVRSFDAACDSVRDHFISLIDEYMIVEETVMVPQVVKRLERII